MSPNRLVTLACALSIPFVFVTAGCSNNTTGTVDAGPDMTLTSRSLTILYTNDEHSHQFAFGPEIDDHPAATTAGTGALKGGASRRKALLDQERAAAKMAGADTLTVSAGDNVAGGLSETDYTRAASDLTLLKQLGYDATAVGNHEFDFGPGGYANAITAAMSNGGAPQIVSTNIHFDPTNTADDALAALYGAGTDSKPIKKYHVVRTANGLKVGFLGITGADAAYKAPLKTPVRFSAPDDKTEADTAMTLSLLYKDIQPTVDTLRNSEKVDIVVALSHSGIYSTNNTMDEDYLIAQNVPGIDVIVSGHTHDKLDKPVVVTNTTSNKSVIIVTAGAYGLYLGRLPLTVSPTGAITHDDAHSQLISIDDTTVPDPTIAKSLDTMITGIETFKGTGTGQFSIADTLSKITGMTVMHDPTKVGDLYFYSLGTTSFDVIGLRNGTLSTPYETNLLNLVADAEMWAATAVLPTSSPPDAAIDVAGAIRADIQKGKSGTLSFADVFRALPLGSDPKDGTIGYPLVAVYLPNIALKGALDRFNANQAFTDSDFYLGVAGLQVTIDTSRPPYNSDPTKTADDPTNGRITLIKWNSKRDGTDNYDVTIFDASKPLGHAFNGAKGSLYVVTSFYIAQLAAGFQVPLLDENGNSVSPADAIISRADNTHLKDFEALAGYVKHAADANGGMLPSNYDAAQQVGTIPRRILCSGPLCQHP